MKVSKIITKFELFMDDSSDLSSSEELDLFNKVQQFVCTERDWKFLRREYSTTADGSTEYDLPTGFSHIVVNYNNFGQTTEALLPIVLVGSDNDGYSPYQVISFQDRNKYKDSTNYCYIDLYNNKLVFTEAPTSGKTIKYDYHYIPSDMDTDDDVIIPDRFAHIIYHGMCADEFIIQQSDKALSYRKENEERYRQYLDRMEMWDSKFDFI